MSAEFPSLTAVLHELVKHAPSELTARTIAELAGKDYNTLMSELSRQPGHKLGADLLLPLMELTGSDAPLNFLARERGGVFVPMRPDATADLGPAILKVSGSSVNTPPKPLRTSPTARFPPTSFSASSRKGRRPPRPLSPSWNWPARYTSVNTAPAGHLPEGNKKTPPELVATAPRANT